MFDVTAMGEILIDFTFAGKSGSGMTLFEQNPGGAPANVLTALSRLGKKTAFAGKVGEDMHGVFLRGILEREGIDTANIISDPTVYTTMAFVDLRPDGERVFSFARKPGADTMLHIGELDLKRIENSRFLHVGSLSLTDEPSAGATMAVLEQVKAKGIGVSFDPNYRPALWPDEESAGRAMKKVIPFADVIKLSDEETALLTPYSEPEMAALWLVEQGVHIVSVTLGRKGALVAVREGCSIVPALPSKVADTTGAGDSYCGAFLYKILESGQELSEISLPQAKEFAAFANAAASVCVSRRGGIPAMPVLAEVNGQIAAYGRDS